MDCRYALTNLLHEHHAIHVEAIRQVTPNVGLHSTSTNGVATDTLQPIEGGCVLGQTDEAMPRAQDVNNVLRGILGRTHGSIAVLQGRDLLRIWNAYFDAVYAAPVQGQ